MSYGYFVQQIFEFLQSPVMGQNAICSFNIQSHTENFWLIRSSVTTIQKNSEKKIQLKSAAVHLPQIREIQGSTESIKLYNLTFLLLSPKSLMWDSGMMTKAMLYRLVGPLHTGFSINLVRTSKLCVKLTKPTCFWEMIQDLLLQVTFVVWNYLIIYSRLKLLNSDYLRPINDSVCDMGILTTSWIYEYHCWLIKPFSSISCYG